ncbi:hypothetical protein I79_009266 [Cricetulus griseus]|uniref:Uncharacterized protein n=1 Tax=Cricetulus griseus TaxID=10029 RepID=G3HFB0_CRIGR|nr:hypothetical protein I79_009266 [Cricetulus griseus]
MGAHKRLLLSWVSPSTYLLAAGSMLGHQGLQPSGPYFCLAAQGLGKAARKQPGLRASKDYPS